MQATERNPCRWSDHLCVASCCSLRPRSSLLAGATTASAATRYLSPSGSDAGNCIAAPCATFGRAYNVAASGDVVVVGPGVYPGRQETPDGGTKTITFRGEPGNKVRQLHNHASNVTFEGLDVDANGGTPTGAAFENHAPERRGPQQPHRQRDGREGRVARRLEQHGVDERRRRQRRLPRRLPGGRRRPQRVRVRDDPGSDDPQLDVPQLRDDGSDDHARRLVGAADATAA